MKHLQMKYNGIQFLYWITNCTIFGYVAIFLQYKGLTNTEIGIVTAMGSINWFKSQGQKVDSPC